MTSNWTTINETYKNIDGYKRVAWPPVAEDKIIRELTPQPQLQNSQPPQQHQPQTGAVSNQSVHSNHAESVDYHHHYNRSTSKLNHHHQEENNYHESKLIWRPQIYQPLLQEAADTIPYHTQDFHKKERTQEFTHQYLNNLQSHNTSKPANNSPEILSYPSMNGNQYNQQSPQHKSWSAVQAPVPQSRGYVQTSQCQMKGSESELPIHCGSNQQQNQAFRAPSATLSQPYDRYQQHQQPQSFGSNPQYNQQQVPEQTFVDGQHLQQDSFSKSPSQQLQQQHQQQQSPLQQYLQQPLSPQAHQIYQHHPENQFNNCYSQPQQHQQQQLSQGVHPQQYRGQSPGIITLRKETPITQQPAPVYTSQPAAASYGGGSKMRGDLKWPPPEYKEQAAIDNEERRRIALGPVCRPRRIHRDYTQFFAKNALNSYYPSYKVPPGTQHMIN